MGIALIVEDDPDIRLLVRSLFAQRGWSVEEEVDGRSASVRASLEFDAIVVDHRIPGISGEEVAAGYRARGYTGPIVLYSAYVDRDLEASLRARVAPEVHVVSKTDFDALAAIIQNLQEGDLPAR